MNVEAAVRFMALATQFELSSPPVACLAAESVRLGCGRLQGLQLSGASQMNATEIFQDALFRRINSAWASGFGARSGFAPLHPNSSNKED